MADGYKYFEGTSRLCLQVEDILIYKTIWHHISVLLTLIKDPCLSGLPEPVGEGTILPKCW